MESCSPIPGSALTDVLKTKQQLQLYSLIKNASPVFFHYLPPFGLATQTTEVINLMFFTKYMTNSTLKQSVVARILN